MVIAPTPRNSCVVVVTYNPDAGLTGRLAAIVPQVGRVIVVDNGSNLAVGPRVPMNVELIEVGRNAGIATALNIGVAAAVAGGFDWVLTMDQDSRVHDDIVEGLTAVYHAHPDPDRVGVVAANFIDAHRGRPFAGTNGSSRLFIEQPVAITSGSLMSVAAMKQVGPFRDDYFIDFVDHEYCLRMRRRGWIILYSTRPLLDHAIGHPTTHRFLWMRPTTSNHSPARRYYITRNRLVTDWANLGDEPRSVITDLWRITGEIGVLILLEDQKWAKVKAICRGIVDAMRGRMGPME